MSIQVYIYIYIYIHIYIYIYVYIHTYIVFKCPLDSYTIRDAFKSLEM